MARELLGIATGAESEAVKLAAVKTVLALAGFNEKTSVEFSAKAPEPWEELVADVTGMATMSRAESRAARGFSEPAALEAGPASESEPLDAEVVDVYDRPTGPPPFATDASAEPGQGNGPAEPRNGYLSFEEAMDEVAEDTRRGAVRGARIREIGM